MTWLGIEPVTSWFMDQYSWATLPGSTILFELWDRVSDGKPRSRANALFINEAKQTNTCHLCYQEKLIICYSPNTEKGFRFLPGGKKKIKENKEKERRRKGKKKWEEWRRRAGRRKRRGGKVTTRQGQKLNVFFLSSIWVCSFYIFYFRSGGLISTLASLSRCTC